MSEKCICDFNHTHSALTEKNGLEQALQSDMTVFWFFFFLVHLHLYREMATVTAESKHGHVPFTIWVKLPLVLPFLLTWNLSPNDIAKPA